MRSGQAWGWRLWVSRCCSNEPYIDQGALMIKNTMESNCVLEISNLSKYYGSTKALIDVSLDLRQGEVRGIVGENGAGKSTLCKILAGQVRPDSGLVKIHGKQLRLNSARASAIAGISVAHQQQMLALKLTVGQNLLMNYKSSQELDRFVSQKKVERLAQQKLNEIGITDIPTDRVVAEVSLPDRNRLEIAKSLIVPSNIVILDEPTGALSVDAVEWLRQHIVRLASEGTTVMYISHRIREILDFCESVTVMGGGRVLTTAKVSDTNSEDIVRMIAEGSTMRKGRNTVNQIHDYKSLIAVENPEKSDVVLEVVDIAIAPMLKPTSFSIQKGNIIGLAALEGQGQRELFEVLFGLRRPTSGVLRLHGRRKVFSSPEEAIRCDLGMAFVPEDCKEEGVIENLNAIANVTLARLQDCATLGVMRSRKEKELAKVALNAVDIKLNYLDDPVSFLSGGNQQKIAIAKWILTGAQLMLMYDPTRGIDPVTKEDIFEIMRRYVASGGAILFYSTELYELERMCDSIFGIYRGHATKFVKTSDSNVNISALTDIILGGRHEESHTDADFHVK